MFCLESNLPAKSKVTPVETYRGWALSILDVPETVNEKWFVTDKGMYGVIYFETKFQALAYAASKEWINVG